MNLRSALLVVLFTAVPATAHPGYDFAVDSRGRTYLLDWPTKQVLRVDEEGAVTVFADLAKIARGTDPHSLDLAPNGALLVAASYEPRIFRVSAKGEVAEWMPERLRKTLDGEAVLSLRYSPRGVLHVVAHGRRTDEDGHIHDVRYRVLRVPAKGAVETILTLEPGEAPWIPLYGGAMVPADDGSLVLTGASRVWRSGGDGPLRAIPESPLLRNPYGLDLGPDGSVIVADSGSHRILRVTRTGEVELVAGSGRRGGKDGAAKEAEFDRPYAVRRDARGQLRVVEYASGEDGAEIRLRRIDTEGRVRTILRRATR